MGGTELQKFVFERYEKGTVIGGAGAVTIVDPGAMTYANTPNIEKRTKSGARRRSAAHFTRGRKIHSLPERQMIILKEAQHKAKRAGVNENA